MEISKTLKGFPTQRLCGLKVSSISHRHFDIFQLDFRFYFLHAAYSRRAFSICAVIPIIRINLTCETKAEGLREGEKIKINQHYVGSRNKDAQLSLFVTHMRFGSLFGIC